MNVILIINKYLDDREFRNYCSYWITKLGYKNIEIEDPRVSDGIKKNDNDFFANKGKKRYTVQTFLNKEVTEKEVNETIKDMIKEKVDNGLIITNKDVSPEFRKFAKEKSIEIIDKKKFTEEI